MSVEKECQVAVRLSPQPCATRGSINETYAATASNVALVGGEKGLLITGNRAGVGNCSMTRGE